MTQITIRKLDPLVIDGLKKRAAEAGRSMEEEARRILTNAVPEARLAHQRAWVAHMKEVHKELFGDKVFPDSSRLIRKMRDERTRQNASWVTPRPLKKVSGRRK